MVTVLEGFCYWLRIFIFLQNHQLLEKKKSFKWWPCVFLQTFPSLACWIQAGNSWNGAGLCLAARAEVTWSTLEGTQTFVHTPWNGIVWALLLAQSMRNSNGGMWEQTQPQPHARTAWRHSVCPSCFSSSHLENSVSLLPWLGHCSKMLESYNPKWVTRALWCSEHWQL